MDHDPAEKDGTGRNLPPGAILAPDDDSKGFPSSYNAKQR